MQMVLAGHGLRVPRCLAFSVASLAAFTLVGCAAMSSSAEKRSVTTTAPVATDPRAEAALETTSSSAGTSTVETSHGRTVTSNGAEFAPNPLPPIVVPEKPARPLEFSLTGTYMYGPVIGSVQNPKNGKRGTTTANRPQFNGMGITRASIEDGELGVKWTPEDEVFIGAQFIRMSGDSTLGRQIVSGGLTYPKGTHTDSDLQLDWYRLGYRRAFVLDNAANGVPDITIIPWADALLWDYSFDFHGNKVGTASNSFTQPGFQLGGTIEWRPNGGPLSFEAAAGSFPLIHDFAQISTESLTAKYHFLEYRQFNFTGTLGVEWEQQHFRDTEKTPNRINAEFGPMIVVGLKVQY